MQYLVTGGSGFIGSHLVDRLLQSPDHVVTAFDNLSRGKLENISRHLPNPKFHFINSDIRDSQSLLKAMEGVDVVYHLAAQSNVMGAVFDPVYSFETNVVGTFNLLNAARETKPARIIFSSSREVYGEPRYLPVKEDHPLGCKNPYGASKIAGELYCGVYRDLYHLDVAILRLSNVYGLRDFDRVIPLWIKQAIENKDLTIFGGEQIIDFIHINIVIEALLQASRFENDGIPINVGSGKGTEIKLLAKQILNGTNSTSQMIIQTSRDAEVKSYIADISRMSAVLNVIPPHNPLEQINEIIQQYKIILTQPELGRSTSLL